MGSAASALIALGVGYLVFLTATKEAKNIRQIGQGIGVLIMLGAVLIIIGGAMRCSYMNSKCASMKQNCPITASMMSEE